MIDLSNLEADGFESLCYDLLDHMGLRNLQWRRGQNEGCSSSDNGRDIEASCTERISTEKSFAKNGSSSANTGRRQYHQQRFVASSPGLTQRVRT